MNYMVNVERSSLFETMSHPVTINMMGKSLEDSDGVSCVPSWLRQGLHLVSHRHVKLKHTPTISKVPQMTQKLLM